MEFLQKTTLNVAGIVEDSITDGPGLRFSLFVQGCPHKCVGCHNPQTHQFGAGQEMTLAEIFDKLRSNPLQSGVTFSGGEPFCQPQGLAILAKEIKACGYDLAAYSGYTFEQLVELPRPGVKELLSQLDVLVDGRFMIEKKDLLILFRGSGNQRIIDVQASLKAGEVVLDKTWLL